MADRELRHGPERRLEAKQEEEEDERHQRGMKEIKGFGGRSHTLSLERLKGSVWYAFSCTQVLTVS